MAQQYEYQAISKANNCGFTIRATARTEKEAWDAVENYYANGFNLTREPISVRPPHEVYGEINCM